MTQFNSFKFDQWIESSKKLTKYNVIMLQYNYEFGPNFWSLYPNCTEFERNYVFLNMIYVYFIVYIYNASSFSFLLSLFFSRVSSVLFVFPRSFSFLSNLSPCLLSFVSSFWFLFSKLAVFKNISSLKIRSH